MSALDMWILEVFYVDCIRSSIRSSTLVCECLRLKPYVRYIKIYNYEIEPSQQRMNNMTPLKTTQSPTCPICSSPLVYPLVATTCNFPPTKWIRFIVLVRGEVHVILYNFFFLAEAKTKPLKY